MAAAAPNLQRSLTWVSGCNQQDVFLLSFTVQSLSQAQLAAGRQAERALIIASAEHVAQLAVGTLVVVSGNNLKNKETSLWEILMIKPHFVYLCKMCFLFPAQKQLCVWNKYENWRAAPWR